MYAYCLAGATHKTKAGIEELLAARFPRSEALGLVTALSAPSGQLAPGQVAMPSEEHLSPGPVEAHVSQLVPERVPCLSKVTPVAAERFDIHMTIGRDTRDKLQRVQELLGHALPTGDIAQVFDRAIDFLLKDLEKRKFAATSRPHRGGRPSANPRHIPAAVKRAMWARDGGQCTFVSESGHRCQARKLI